MTEKKQANRYAVVDLEATSSSSYAKIIQIGIVIVEAGQIVETYATDINPYEKLDVHIRELTGITDQQLAVAPDFGQVAKEIYDLLEGTIFVAHNVSFDANLLAEALFFEGYELRTPRVDTVELAQLFFPTLDKYSLVNLAQDLDLELEQAHTAISDATATAKLLLKIQEKIQQLPKQTVGQILTFANHLLYESRLVIDELYPTLSDYLPEDIINVNGLCLKKIAEQQPTRYLSKNVARNLALLGLDERPQQLAFAEIVEKRLVEDQERVHFIQAQAGIGKTYGYLLPLIAQGDKPLLVVVPTKVLQQQILENEGLKLSEIFHISIASIKSSRHYIKLDTFWRTLERLDDNRLLNRYKMHLLVWLCETETGDMDELKQKQRYQSYFDELQHDGNWNSQSLFGEWDFWHRAQETAQTSQLVLTNHAYFLEHLRHTNWMKERILVIDEAQKFMLAAEEYASQELSISACQALLQSKLDRAKEVLETRLLEACYFELQHLIEQFQTQGKRALTAEDLASLKQNLAELDDADFWDWVALLEQDREYWLEERRLQAQRLFFLRSSQVDMLDVARFLPSTKIFCISATLEISKKVNVADLLGFHEVTHDCLPSMAKSNQLIMYSRHLPDLVSMNKAEHAHFICQQLNGLIQLRRPILVLLTSIQLLLEVSNLLEEMGISHLSQHKHGQEMSIKRRFEKGEVAVLLGTGAFWEGVDFASQPELIQVIPRLPFENPQDRFVKKVNRRLKAEGKNPFYDYHLPMMMLKLKQAMGRSNRSAQQKSCVLLLDNRLIEKQYGQQIQYFLETEYQMEQLSQETVVDRMRRFFKENSSG
ncbi:bifunctional DnaQ family exonuclease/ATP-dependent helicase [Streptococcus sp. zg-86]|uniref:3'-5' exonuclease DinG n=1 Tax=Streptococcus zhangguiae TaxID=2664091 RepID=A0A6I4RK31_9STRE|nr:MULTISPECIES: bifunctional DnaQ family exonuclease/ATP-dependent helicase [unclassified Streptococcus]MTB64972.1 bifunctional DnaQ family exonuclease/ATP-dependent helicase [Streptococcus sp. zg-86]MTB91186.1 bifunctional DnaQ family exonuclease/ATP-dependent helicase [Streptococcus sp. zg-36]MWV56943.1 bifunctional DnaQ family exonuclease/ATP-dependent helicase [Streptococcus sp. zg-70]QTH47181.1 bifunctional DnaQ family exonuclease/ATP-dependent helicase [Streptococcus sp. zg-86]